jgi:hypothetical protein
MRKIKKGTTLRKRSSSYMGIINFEKTSYHNKYCYFNKHVKYQFYSDCLLNDFIENSDYVIYCCDLLSKFDLYYMMLNDNLLRNTEVEINLKKIIKFLEINKLCKEKFYDKKASCIIYKYVLVNTHKIIYNNESGKINIIRFEKDHIKNNISKLKNNVKSIGKHSDYIFVVDNNKDYTLVKIKVYNYPNNNIIPDGINKKSYGWFTPCWYNLFFGQHLFEKKKKYEKNKKSDKIYVNNLIKNEENNENKSVNSVRDNDNINLIRYITNDNDDIIYHHLLDKENYDELDIDEIEAN